VVLKRLANFLDAVTWNVAGRPFVPAHLYDDVSHVFFGAGLRSVRITDARVEALAGSVDCGVVGWYGRREVRWREDVGMIPQSRDTVRLSVLVVEEARQA
jgi:hypothetical protein